MKRFLTCAIIGLAVIFLWAFCAQTVAVMDNVYIESFTLSEDGQTMTIRVAVGVSVGYTRSVTVKDEGSALRLVFHPAYGFVNGKIGAKNTFDLPLKPYQNKIYIQSSGEVFHGLLRSDDGTWSMQNFSASPTPGGCTAP